MMSCEGDFYLAGGKCRTGHGKVTILDANGMEQTLVVSSRRGKLREGEVSISRLAALKAKGRWDGNITVTDDLGRSFSTAFDPTRSAATYRPTVAGVRQTPNKSFNPGQFDDVNARSVYVREALLNIAPYAKESLDYTDAVLAAARVEVDAGRMPLDDVVVGAMVRRVVDREGEFKDYYAKKDREHWGDEAVGSKFSELSGLDATVAECIRQRGHLDGDDRDQLRVLHAARFEAGDPRAELNRAALAQGFRYLVLRTPGELGMTSLASLPEEALVRINARVPQAGWSFMMSPTDAAGNVVAYPRDTVDFATVIVTPEGDVATAHPGAPAPVSLLRKPDPKDPSRNVMVNVLEEAGFDPDTAIFSVADLLDRNSDVNTRVREVHERYGGSWEHFSEIKLPSAPTPASTSAR